MNSSDAALADKDFIGRALEAAIRIGLLFVVVSWCFQIFRPFLTPVIWGVIISVAVCPLYLRLLNVMRGNERVTAITLTLLLLALLITPALMLGASLAEEIQAISQGLESGELKVPVPPEGVASWPLVGEKLSVFWTLASQNLTAAIHQITPQLKAMVKWLLNAGFLGVIGLLQFVFAIIIAGILLISRKTGQKIAYAFTQRVAGDFGKEFADTAVETIRSVAIGVVGVALIQSVLAGIGLLVMAIPGAGVLTLLILLLSVMQISPILVLLPIIIYVLSTGADASAIVFAIWSLLAGISDNFLKPLLLGRGVDIPMLIILIGALGGMIAAGIIGLFVGAVILALGYKLLLVWLHTNDEITE